MNYKKLLVSLALPQIVGLTAAFFTSSGVSTWYTTIEKPAFTPPGWVFGPAWTLLYLLMGIALYLVWQKGFEKTKPALLAFGVQLVLNGFWSVIFFKLQAPLYAFIELVVLWSTILLTTAKFYKFSKKAAYLLVPYIAWVSFAGVLNFTIVMLN